MRQPDEVMTADVSNGRSDTVAKARKPYRKPGQDISLQEALQLLPQLCGELYVPPERLTKIDRLGEGAFATVDVCELKLEDGTSKEVAVKRIRKECTPDKDALKDFVMEVCLMSKLKHSCVVETLGVGAFGGKLDSVKPTKLYTVQELMAGGDLNTVLLRQCMKPKIPLYKFADALRWGQQMARGLRYLHSSTPMIIHRDMKLDNVLLTDFDLLKANAKLGDFGLMVLSHYVPPNELARKSMAIANQLGLKSTLSGRNMKMALQASYMVTSGAEPDPSQLEAKDELQKRVMSASLRSASLAELAQIREASKLPGLKGMLGSVPYIAPEVVKHKAYNEKVDIFALGMMLYELFSRKLITYDMVQRGKWKDSAAYIPTAARQVADGYRPEFAKNFPKEMKPLIERCWHTDAANRPTANELYEMLKNMAEAGTLDKYDDMKVGDASSKKGRQDEKVQVVTGCNCAIM